ncbi:hypothetical protein [Pseudodesulfovibrio sediminis]|uniref:Uncharacterized protein n=1 Tax=Pseudodesulfovibrio sediminis TaxID=2810563 RepID=A0ABN6EV51_9BACT|nr:hypothetical protein [Pseudodesulfovibrio sediminis]BCS89407.1 hypothetical protein PSDVSF_26490 [Pseudodesulfovibrio sediminis]
MNYTVSILNPTPVEYTYIIYQTLPRTKSCTSVVWMMGDIPANTGTPTPVVVPWINIPSVVLGDRDNAQLTQTQLWDVELHTRWLLEYDVDKEDYELKEMANVGSKIKDEIIIENRSGKEVDIGIALSQIAGLYWENVLSNENVSFKMDETYHLALLLPIQKAEVGQIVAIDDSTDTPGALQREDIVAMSPIHFSSPLNFAQATIVADASGVPEVHISYPT